MEDNKMFDLPVVTDSTVLEDNQVPFQTQTEEEVMPTFTPEEVSNVEVPPEEKKTEESPVETVSDPVEVVEENTVEPTVITQPTGPDETFNCPNCKGSGLVVNSAFPDGVICAACGGVGKQ